MNNTKIRPVTVRNRILYVLAIHGVEQQTAQSIYDTLTSGNDPRPSDIPASFTFQGVTLHYPSGVGRRIITPVERKALNAALRLNNNELLDSEDTAHDARRAYTALWHKHQRLMDDLVEEACGSYDQRLDTHGQDTALDLTAPAEQADEGAKKLLTEIFAAPQSLDNVLCGHRKPGGRLICMEDNHHGGLHHNGQHSWTETEVVVIQHHAPKRQTVKAKSEPVTSDLDDLMAQLASI